MSAAEGSGGTGRKPRVLVVEDEYLVALLVEEMLQALGYDVAEIAGNINAATAAAEAGDFDLAVIDVNLNGTYSSPVADILTRRRIPFVFATGYGAAGPHEGYTDVLSLTKPFEQADLKRALAGLMAGRL